MDFSFERSESLILVRVGIKEQGVVVVVCSEEHDLHLIVLQSLLLRLGIFHMEIVTFIIVSDIAHFIFLISLIPLALSWLGYKFNLDLISLFYLSNPLEIIKYQIYFFVFFKHFQMTIFNSFFIQSLNFLIYSPPHF